jgi:glycerophosphoryl diester phosphodiesterase
MSSRPLLLGHRGTGAVRSIPENTFAAFDRALADGCDGFEFDVRLTADSQAVICHDPKVGAFEVAGATAHQLADLPRLNEVLKRYQNSACFDIELKVSGLERITVESLRDHTPRRGFLVSSFLPEVLQVLHREDSSIPLGLICETKSQLQQWRKLPLEYVVPHYKLVNEGLIRPLTEVGRKIIVWTVNDPQDMRRYAKLGVEGIISDDTARLVQAFGPPDSK